MFLLIYAKLILIYCAFKIIKCNDYKKVILEDLSVEFVNETYFDKDTLDISLNYKRDSQSTLNIKFDVIEELPQEIYIKAKLLGKGLGQYNVPTGVSFDFNICNNKLRDFLFGTIMEKLGWDGTCPPKKGRYEALDFDPNIGGFPLAALPGFRMLIDAELYSFKISLIKLKAYVQIANS